MYVDTIDIAEARPGSHWKRGVIIAGSAAFALTVLLVHQQLSPAVYDFTGTLSVDRSLAELGAMLLIAVLPTAWLPLQAARPSLLGLWLLYLAVYVPAIVVAPQVYVADIVDFGPFFLCLVASMAGLSIPYLFEVRPLPRSGLSIETLIVLLVAGGVFWAVYSLLTVGLRFDFVAQEDLYDERYFIRDQLALSGEYLWQYLSKWTSDAIVPALIAVGVVYRRAIPFVLAIGFAVVLGASTAARGPFVAIAFALGTPLWAAYSTAKGYEFDAFRLVLAVLAGAGALIAWDSIVGTDDTYWLTHLIFMRIFVVPGILTGYHLEFFSVNPPALFGEGILGWILNLEGAYREAVSVLIGYYYIYAREAVVVANANTWADWYANLGLLGILISSLVMGILFYLVDKLAAGRDLRLAAAMLAPMGINLANTGVQTVFVSGGFWLMLVILWLLPPAVGGGGYRRDGDIENGT